MLDTASTIASPQASGKTRDIAIFAARSALGSGRPLATATGSMIAGASQGARKVTLAGGTPTLGGFTTIVDTESSPTGHTPANNTIRDAHAHAVPDNAETVMISPLAVGFPLLSTITAASQVKGGGSDGAAASRDAAIAGTASVSGAIGETPAGIPKRSQVQQRRKRHHIQLVLALPALADYPGHCQLT